MLGGAIVLQIILIVINAIFACAQSAVLACSEAKLEKLSDEGNTRAKRLLPFTRNSSVSLSGIKAAVTLVTMLGSAYAADDFSTMLMEALKNAGLTVGNAQLNNLCVFLIVLVLSYFTIVLGERVPMRLALKAPEKTALSLSGVLIAVTVLFKPLVFIVDAFSKLLLRFFGVNSNESGENVTEEDIRILLDTGSERGTIDSAENEMIKNVFELDDISISEVCTHRRDVNFLYRDDGIEEWRELVRSTRHNYYPVCGEDDDDVIGILSVRKFFRLDCNDTDTAIREATDKPFLVPENMKADVLLEQMQKTRNYFAIVIDEYGGTRGVITVHDLLELLVGRLDDKDAETVEEIKNTGENTWEILGSASIGDVEKVLELELCDEDNDTFGGYILGILGAIPDDGATEDLETADLRIHVASVADHRIEKTVVVCKTADEKEAEAREADEAKAKDSDRSEKEKSEA
ncbi:MAG: HlyC/CorC family transporter [Clostridia bacterium]|nr:HlyC/CorC family transporter [Clostridia bacterium]